MQPCEWTGPRDRLFVYGTLRPRSGNVMGRVLMHNARALGTAAMPGSVRRAGAYTVANVDAQGGWVRGEVFEVTGGRGVWRVLDRYEGCGGEKSDYARRRVAVRLVADGREHWTTAWCYVMAKQPEAGDAMPARQPG
jgi:gamma-glutamylcyclotransferase (GGCT)/AIG2-like uncharacterized protein YtfP